MKEAHDVAPSQFLKAAAASTAVLALCTVGFTPATADTPATPKNVILLIGDGMGYNYLDLYNAYNTGKVHHQVETGGDNKAIPASTINTPYEGTGFQSWNRLSMQTNWAEGPAYDQNLAWSDFGWVKNNPTDSAAAGTALATGVKTYNAGVGVDINEKTVENVSERAKSLGKSAGVVSSVQYSHATPATFSSHALARSDYHGIAHQQVTGDMDVVMGAGHPWYNDDHQKLEAANYKYITEEDYTALSTGQTDFTFVEDKAAFEQLTSGDTPDKVFGIAQVGTTLQQARTDIGSENNVADLPTMTEGALNVLDNNDDGFFLMVEGGAIDWTGHSNQTDRALEETTDFFEAVESVEKWVETNSNWDETLVIVTADHETGYLMGDPSGGFNPMKPQGVGNYPTLSWNSDNHTNQLVPYYTKGVGSEALNELTIGRDQIRGRYLDNTSLATWLLTEAWVAGATDDDVTPEPTVAPTDSAPTAVPTVAPTGEPSVAPTAEPSVAPSVEPSAVSSESAVPPAVPSVEPSVTGSAVPSEPVKAVPSAVASSSAAVVVDAGSGSSGKKQVLAHTGATVAAVAGVGVAALVAGGVLLSRRRSS